MDNQTLQWYMEPLKLDDFIAGFSLLFFGIFFILLYSMVAWVMFKSDKDIIGFRFLFSAAVADILLLFNYGIWGGLTILFKSEIISPGYRHWIQMYLDWVWFSMCYHYMVVSWSRFAAIRYPNTFRIQRRSVSYGICGCCYVLALVQVLCTHFQSWYVVFYFEPSQYGMLSEDFNKYLSEGQSLFFITFHILMVIIPIFFYSYAIVILLRHKQRSFFHLKRDSIREVKCFKDMVTSTAAARHSNIEARLMIPCIFNTIMFIIGQVVITLGTGEGKWASFLVLVLFAANSAVNPILLITFSTTIRKKIIEQLGYKPWLSEKIGLTGIAASFTHPKSFAKGTNYRNSLNGDETSTPPDESRSLSLHSSTHHIYSKESNLNQGEAV
uniref:G_PROTEIN_RECEP_F1_2 domain-containing protein n=1 Tax=Rhabditophanes sp. KR3021 TaxID=114890 RepID=A0AC35U1Q8_9BILA